MNKIIIITHLFYPANTPRANRSFELAKELAKSNNVIVYCVTGGYDYTMIEDTYGFKVKNLGKLFFSNYTSVYQGYDYFFTRIFRKFFGKYLQYPEIELSYQTYRVLKKETNYDSIISIGAPHTIHWGVALFKSLTNNKKKWIADCGDPFMGNMNLKYPFYFKYIEKWFCKKVDFITVPMEDAKTGYYNEFLNKIKVIPQGFNFELSKINQYSGNKIITFIYSGIFYEKIRNPKPFLEYLITLDIDFRFIVYTKSHNLIEPYQIKLGDKLIIKEYIPREELLIQLSKADFLINFENINIQQSPSKLIDYALSGRPILSINTADVLDTTTINEFLNKNYYRRKNIDNIEQYNIKNVAIKFKNLLFDNI